MTTISQRISFPNQALLFDLEQLYRCLQTVPDRCKRRGLRYQGVALVVDFTGRRLRPLGTRTHRRSHSYTDGTVIGSDHFNLIDRQENALAKASGSILAVSLHEKRVNIQAT